MKEVDGEVRYQFCLSDSLKQSWRNGSRPVQRCGECFIVLHGAVNANDFAAAEQAALRNKDSVAPVLTEALGLGEGQVNFEINVLQA